MFLQKSNANESGGSYMPPWQSSSSYEEPSAKLYHFIRSGTMYQLFGFVLNNESSDGLYVSYNATDISQTYYKHEEEMRKANLGSKDWRCLQLIWELRYFRSKPV